MKYEEKFTFNYVKFYYSCLYLPIIIDKGYLSLILNYSITFAQSGDTSGNTCYI